MRSINGVNVCVVGGAGFLGSHLVDHLFQDRGCNVLVLDNLCAGRREFVNLKARFLWCDITDSEDHLARVFAENDIEYAFNYAAHPYVPDSYDRPLHVWETNANGAMKVINAACTAGVKAILQVSSAEVYGQVMGDRPYDPIERDSRGSYDEEDQVFPHSSYGASKAAIDAFVQVRWREAKVPCIALRQFNCIGERDVLHPYVLPEIISQLYKFTPGQHEVSHEFELKEGTRVGEVIGVGDLAYVGSSIVSPFVSLGNNSSRDFLYAGDAVRMAVELLEKGSFGEVYNLGSQESIKVYDLAKLVGKVMGFADVRVGEDESRKRAWEIWHLQADNSKLYSVIDARPAVSLEEGIRRTVKWFEDNGRGWPWEAGVRDRDTSRT